MKVMIKYWIKYSASPFSVCVWQRQNCITNCIMQGRVITFLHFADTLGLLSPFTCGEQHKDIKQTGNLERVASHRQKTSRATSNARLTPSSYRMYLQINQYDKRQSCHCVCRIPENETRHLVPAPTLIKQSCMTNERLSQHSADFNDSNN